MTDKERFEKCFTKGERRYIAERRAFIQEQEYLRRKFYYNPAYGNKLVLFFEEMRRRDYVEVKEINDPRLPF